MIVGICSLTDPRLNANSSVSLFNIWRNISRFGLLWGELHPHPIAQCNWILYTALQTLNYIEEYDDWEILAGRK